MLNSKGTQCITCGATAPQWVEADDYDNPEDFGAVLDAWEVVHENCNAVPVWSAHQRGIRRP